jgi:tetrahydromethanopterin S-methyltransferase subunit G
VDAQFAEVNRRLDSLGEKLEAFARVVSRRMDAMDGRFDAVERRIDSVERNLTARLDRHFEIFHSHEARLNDPNELRAVNGRNRRRGIL